MVYEFFGPASLGFGSGSKSDDTIFFEVEFRGVGTEQFDMEALLDIHVGIHGTPGRSDTVWTVAWNGNAASKRFACSSSYFSL